MTQMSALEHPTLQFWETMYKEQKDLWTIKVADDELLKFHDMLTNGKSGLDIIVCNVMLFFLRYCVIIYGVVIT